MPSEMMCGLCMNKTSMKCKGCVSSSNYKPIFIASKPFLLILVIVFFFIGIYIKIMM